MEARFNMQDISTPSSPRSSMERFQCLFPNPYDDECENVNDDKIDLHHNFNSFDKDMEEDTKKKELPLKGLFVLMLQNEICREEV